MPRGVMFAAEVVRLFGPSFFVLLHRWSISCALSSWRPKEQLLLVLRIVQFDPEITLRSTTVIITASVQRWARH